MHIIQYKNLFESFKAWSSLKEQDDDQPLTFEQNETLKKFYISKIKPLLDDILMWIKSNNITLDKEGYINFRKNYKPPQGYIKETESTIKFDFSEFKDTLPISDDFEIKITAVFEQPSANLAFIDDKAVQLNFAFTLMDDQIMFKSEIQHELQHFFSTGAEMSSNKAEHIMDYLINKGEITAFAKQMAYIFVKSKPENYFFDEKAFEVYKQKKNIFGNYYNFLTKPEEVVKRTKVDQSYIQKLKDAGKLFLKYVQFFVSEAYNKKTV